MWLAVYALVVTLLCVLILTAYVGQTKAALDAQIAVAALTLKLNALQKAAEFSIEIGKATGEGRCGVHADQTKNTVIAWRHCKNPGEVRDYKHVFETLLEVTH